MDVYEEFASVKGITREVAKSRLFSAMYTREDTEDRRWLIGKLPEIGRRKLASNPALWRFSVLVDEKFPLTGEVIEAYLALGFERGETYAFDEVLPKNGKLVSFYHYSLPPGSALPHNDQHLAKQLLFILESNPEEWQSMWSTWVEPVLEKIATGFALTLLRFGWQYPNDVEDLLNEVSGKVEVHKDEVEFLQSLAVGKRFKYEIWQTKYNGVAEVVEALPDGSGWMVSGFRNGRLSNRMWRLDVNRLQHWTCYELE